MVNCLDPFILYTFLNTYGILTKPIKTFSESYKLQIFKKKIRVYTWHKCSCYLEHSGFLHRFSLPSLLYQQGGQGSGSPYWQKVLQSPTRPQWHGKQYKKGHLGTALKADCFGGPSHIGIVLGKGRIETKQAHSAIRKCVRVLLTTKGMKITALCAQGWLC